MEPSKKVIHDGIVSSIGNNFVIVKIVNKSACASCHAKGACGISDFKEKEIEITLFPDNIKVGQKVAISCKEQQGLWALLLGYIFPFLLLMAMLIVLLQITRREDIAGIGALTALVPYYFTLYLLRKRLKKKFTFRIERILDEAINHTDC